MKRDYYKDLGVPRDAPEKDIKSAFRKIAKTCHPDATVSADVEKRKALEDRFKQISEAYNVLSDPQKRIQYDRYATAEAEKHFDPMNTIIIWRGTNIYKKIPLSPKEAKNGARRKIKLERKIPCLLCSGRQPIFIICCPRCGGKGYEKQKKTLEVNIPSGINEKTTIKLTGQGNASSVQSLILTRPVLLVAGDILITIKIKRSFWNFWQYIW